MGCVNKSSKEFKDLAAKHNLDSNALELITHKYWLQTGNETLFPTDIYIQHQLGNTLYQESSKAVRKLWEMKYSTPTEYSTRDSLQEAKSIALQYFPEEAVVSYKNAKGNFVLSIKKPVEKINRDKANYFRKEDKAENTKDVKLLKLNIKDNQTYGIGKVKELFDKFNTDKTSKDLANKVFSIADKLNLQISFNETLPEGTVGRYNTNTVVYKKSFFERDINNNEKAPILLHEVLHALSIYALSDKPGDLKNTKELEKFRTEINSIYQDLKNNPILKGERGIVDIYEFVAELANPVFRAKLQEIDKQIKKNQKAQKQSFWQRILNAFKSLLGLHVTNSYYQRSMNALDKALNAFDLDTYIKYNGVKNIFRELSNELGDNINSMSDDELKAKAAAYFDKELYSEELQAIKKKAIADGTFMKAPNGKTTNLTERQWLQVRSKAFKEWFGDWENDPENASKVVDENGEPMITYHTSPSDIENNIFRNAQTLEINKDEEWVTDKDIEEYLKEGYIISKKDIERYNNGQTIEISRPNAIYTSSEKEVSNSYAPKEYEAFDSYDEYFDSNVEHWQEERSLEREAIYDHFIETINVDEDHKPSKIGYDKYEQYKKELASKLTDEEMKKRHGDEHEKIKYENPYEYTDDILGSEHALLVSLKKPLIVDADNHNWNDIEYNGKKYSTRTLEVFARDSGYDGVIVKNVFDTGSYSQEAMIPSTVTASFNSNQVKSATDNVGTFYTDHDDIYNYEVDNSNINDQLSNKKNGTNHPRYMDADAVREFINNMSAKDLRDELGLVNQESHDYDLVNGVEEKPKHSGKAVPQDFTFSDGTTVKAPFRPNAQQVDALNTMADFINSKETSMTLSGYAGTGKTSLMEMIANKCRKNYKNVVFCASTNKAAAVLNDKVKKAGFEAKTLNKIFGIQVEIDPDSKEYDVRNTRNKIDEDALMKQGVFPGTTVIIDEASMINEENYNTINRMAKDFGLKIIYVGDSAQLAPVNEDDISKVFRNGDGKVITLTQVERTGDNAILKEATDLRNDKPLSGESSFNSKGEGVAYVSPQHRESINNIIAHYVNGLKSDSNLFRILAYTNAAVAKYNQQVRHLLGYDTVIPQKGEPMTGYINWGYDWKTGKYRLINSESYKVVKTDKPKTLTKRISDGRVITIEAVPVTLEDSMGKVDTFDFIDVKTNPLNKQAAETLAYEKKELWAKWGVTPGKKAKTDILDEINGINGLLFINDDIIVEENGKKHYLQKKAIDFGYAMTVHKSQGSTFTNVLVDDVNISRAAFNKNNNNAANNMEAVDLGNVEERNGSNAEMVDSEAVDLFSENPTESPTPTKPTVSPEGAKLVQQLEYVAVTRATDTVTIISNDVKKEGSPLHPEATQSHKTEEHKTPVNPKNNTINSTPQRSDNFKEATFYSGGAKGSDSYWAEAANKVGAKVKHYTVSDWDNLSKEWKEKLDKEYQEVVSILGRRVMNANTYSGKLVRRDMMQANKADAIFAIGTLGSDGYVRGGTAYATTRGIQRGIPVYLFDQSSNSWKVWSNGAFMEALQPNLTKNAAVIGTRELQDNGRKAIDALFKEFNNATNSTTNSITSQLVSHLKAAGINVLGKDAMAEFLKTHNIEGLQQARAFSESFPYHNSQKASESERREIKDIIRQKKYNKSGSDIVTLDSNGNKTLYLIDHSSHSVFLSNEKEDKKRGVENDLFGIREVYNIDKLSSDDIREIIKNISPAYEYSSGRVLHALQTVGLGQKHLLGINLATELKRAADSNDVFHGKNRGIWNKRWLRYDNSNSRKSSGNEGNLGQEGIETFTTPQGEVYGFVDKDGNIYLDETKISPEHPIHEYTHLWDRTVQKHNPKLWNRGVELMKQSSLWNDVLNDEHYGKQWQSMNLPKERLENLIASEVHARIVGENGEKLLNNIAKRNGQSGIVAKLKQWVLDMWKEVKATFGSWSQEDLDALTINDFNHMTVRDFVDSTNLKDATDASYTEQQSNRFKTVNEVWENLGGYFEGAGLNINKDFPNASKEDISTLEDNYMAPDRYPLSNEQIIEIGNRIVNSNTINNGTEEYKTTDEFRRVQEASRKLSEKGTSKYNKGETTLTDKDRERIGRLLGRLLESNSNGSWYGVQSHLTHVNKDGKTGSFNVGKVDGKLFHDIFGTVRTYLRNGELVDLHKDYSDCKCFVTDDGLCGFAIEPNGNLVSVFSLSPDTNKGFLYAIKDFVRQEGATHLDAYMSKKQPLQEIYKKTLGFYPASIMDYNMDYDQNDIAKNHGMPQVVFMVDHEVAEPKHFDKDSYEDAQQYQLEQLKKSDTDNTTTDGSGIQMVSLPGYELYNTLPSNVPVDAEWKVSYLKELDAQLSMRKSKEENDKIINQMDTILQSPSEKEYRADLKKEKENKTEKQLSEYEKLNKQIDNLLDGRVMDEGDEITSISASEVRHAAQQVADEISDFITELQQDGSKANEWFPTFTGHSDFSKVSRKDIVEAVGINNLIQRAKDFMDTEKYPIDNFDTSCQADLLFDNWDAVMYLAADIFAFNEGFGIGKDYTNGNFTTTEKQSVDYDNFNDYSNDPDVNAEEGEGGKDEQEHWQIENRTIDVLNSMSALVRQGLHQCYILDKDGNKVMSKWNLPERVNPRNVTNSILRWCQGAQSLEDMVAKMSEKQVKNPWLSQLIDRLSDTSGNETDFQSQFYTVFAKDFQAYSVVKLENGKYYSMPVNSHPALSEAMNAITAQFKVGQHPLFGVNGKVNKEMLGSKDTVGKNNNFNLHKALVELQEIDKSLKENNPLNEEMTKKATAIVAATCKVFGYPVTEDMVAEVINAENIDNFTKYLHFAVDSLDAAANSNKAYDPFKFHGENSIDGTLRNFLTPITDVLEDTAVNAFYDSGKMYQSYVTPSFLTRLMQKFKTLSGQKFEDFIMHDYGSSGWFKDEKFIYNSSRGWRNRWLRLLATDENARKVFDHKVELNFNKHNYMRNMTDAEYTLSLITEYFSSSQEGTAWFRIPMQSNKPSSEFIKFYTYTDENTYKDDIVDDLHEIFLQEVSRIQTVRRRNYSKSDSEFIKNFDTNGRKFCFLPVLNAYLNNSAFDISHRDVLKNEDGSVSSDNAKFAALLQKYVNGEVELTSEESTDLDNLVDRVIRQSTEDRVQSILDKWEKEGILEAAKSIKNIYPSFLDNSKEDVSEKIKDEVRKKVENFLWNDSLASKNILQLTITDIAFYKDTEDLQKRMAQLHAPGLRGRKNAVDYEGNPVSDGNYRTVVLKDWDNFISNIVANINEVFDRKIAAAPDNQKAVLRNLKDSLTRPRTYNPDGSVKDKGGKYWNINVADAQGFSSPSSYRKKAFIFGRWSRKAEDLYNRILEGKATYTDFETAFQPLKPFVYSKLTKNMGVDNAPIHSMQVPFQAKNSEYLLIMADAILKGEELSRPNLLRAVYRVMEDSEKLMPTKGIDTIQFESAIKSGLQGAMDIHQFMNTPGGEEAAYTFMKNQIFKEEYDNNTHERVYRNYNTDTFVHETSYDNYCLQQEIPEHFKNHSQAHGSQIRMITPSDLDSYTTDANGNKVDNYYEWTEPDGNGGYIKKRAKADEFRKEYENTIAESIKASLDNLRAELHLDSKDPKEINIALSKILQREILGSPRYGIDLLQACSVDKETGEFRIPKGDPIQAKRIEQLINSVIKNRVNKQEIAGGPIVQVSNFGTSKQLHIRFNDKQGNLIPLEKEYNPADHNNKSYKEYLKENQGGIAYFEVYAPMWDDKVFEMFSNPDGTINTDAIEAVDPELLKMVSYRIPTEDKYSCAPMKVVGFMPREAGDAIMLPYELTEIDDSDFDIDKRYVMRKEIPIKKKSRKEINNELFNIVSKSYEDAHGRKNNKWVGEQVRMFLDNPQKMRNTDKFNQWLYSQYQRVAFYTEIPTSGKLYRDNKIVDMTFGVLTNEMTADKILNPGGFDAPKKMGYMVAVYKNPNNTNRWEELQEKSIDELKDLSYTEKDITFADTQVQFYKQNAAAASLIGVFAVNKVAHATLEGNDILLDVAEFCGDSPFNIGGHYETNPQTGKKEIVGGRTFKGRMLIDTKYDTDGNLIGKTLGSLVSASADAVKDPILNLMNINMTTAGMLNTMLRLGMTFNDAALFLSQDVIERMLNQFNKENLSNYESLNNIINKWLIKYEEKEGIDDSSPLKQEPLTKEELIEGLKPGKHTKVDYKVLLAFQKLKALTDAMRKPTYITRFNSISSAVGPLIVDNLITEHKVQDFTVSQSGEGPTKTGFYTSDGTPIDAESIMKEHPILKQFHATVDLAKDLFHDMPTGSKGFRSILQQLPEGLSDIMYRDKKLLDQLSNFYQSYLLIQSGVVDEKDLKDLIEDFPKEFIEKGYKKKYPDNALIQAVEMNVLKKTGKSYLKINITGMDEQQKEELRAAWIDLHKTDPELSKKLFDYSFFRAGVGFSPKTFMALVPTYVKERLKGKNGASYIDTYRKFPSVINDFVIDQFCRNNLDNNKIAPWKGGEGTHYSIDLKKGTLKAYQKEDIADLNGVSFMKTKTKGSVQFWEFEGKDANGDLVYKQIKPLGNNGEYLEMSTSNITTPLNEIKEISENNDPSSLKESSPSETDSTAPTPPTVTALEKAKKVAEIINLIMKQVPRYSKEEAANVFEKAKENPKRAAKFLQNVFKQAGLDLSIDETLEKFKEYC
mgnify:CR=1 FL=1